MNNYFHFCYLFTYLWK